MSNRLFQSIVFQLKNAVDRVIGVLDENGTIISCTELSYIGEQRSGIIEELSYGMEQPVFEGYTYKVIGISARPDYAVFVEGEDRFASEIAGILSISLGSVKEFSDERFDRSSFVKNILLDNILPGEITLKARELHFAIEIERCVLVIRLMDKSDVSAYDVLQSIFPDKNKDFIINISETDIALVKEVKVGTEPEDLEKLARSIVDTLHSEFYTKSVVGIGTVVKNLNDLSHSFKEAQVSLEVGKVFDTDKSIISYNNLGIGRLIYQLPITLCEMYLNEVFKRGTIDSLDYETLYTIQKFFENSLNVSETSRKLFVHRNTLVYRLEKIRRITGLDLREFDHAIVFKVALMVKKYLESDVVKF
ncbi:MAG: helix-turn-helix domain-containing protein [Clostridia bacterium]|nr:helix-turn-helix domain-containing protein [Clostridia bacterium]